MLPKYRVSIKARNMLSNVLLETFCSEANEEQINKINEAADKYAKAREVYLRELNSLRGSCYDAIKGYNL